MQPFASNITIGKADERKLLCASQSSRCCAAYIYAASGPGESTTDLAWDGQGSIYEFGELLAESSRFARDPELAVADIDVQRLRLERMRMGTFNDNAIAAGHPEKTARRIHFEHKPNLKDVGFERKLRRFPYVPNRLEQLDQDCYEAFNIQVQGLAKRFRATSGKHLVIGVSGGLDSTHALIVAAKVCDYRGAPEVHHPRLHHARLRDRRGHQGQCLGADEVARHRRRRNRHQAGGSPDAGGHGAPLRQG
jgi:NAD+ synthase (glutamine-hydrolysing)